MPRASSRVVACPPRRAPDAHDARRRASPTICSSSHCRISKGAPRWDTPTTYVDNLPIAETVTYEWNHGLGEIVQAVIDAGLRVTAVREHPYCEWQALPTLVEVDDVWVLPEGRDRLPLMFTLEAFASTVRRLIPAHGSTTRESAGG